MGMTSNAEKKKEGEKERERERERDGTFKSIWQLEKRSPRLAEGCICIYTVVPKLLFHKGMKGGGKYEPVVTYEYAGGMRNS